MSLGHQLLPRAPAVPLTAAVALAVALMSTGPGSASARDLYVDAAHPAAADRNEGSQPGQPLETISAGVARAFPGDTVRVAPGTYRESIRFPRSGAGPERRIHVVAAGGGEVVVKGSDVVTGWTAAGGGIWKKTGWKVNSQQVFGDGRPLQQTGVTSPFHTRAWDGRPILPPVGRGLADMTPNSFFHDARSATLYVRLPDDGDPNAHRMEASDRDDVLSSGTSSFIELRGLEFSHSNGSAGGSMRGMVNVEGNSWTVTGCAFTYGDFVGLSISGQGHRIQDNVANHNGDLGIAINGSDAAHGWAPYVGRPAQDIVLEGNETSYNNYRGFYRYYQSGGVKASNSCNGVRVLRHTARANDGPGLWFDLGCRNITIARSILQGNSRGIEYEISDQAVISHNLVTGSSEQGIYVSASSHVSVANNTLDHNLWGIVVHGAPRPEHPQLKENALRNNVIRETGKADLVMYVGEKATGNTSDHNRFYRRGGGVEISWTRTARYPITHRSLRKFAEQTGQDSHSSTEGAEALAAPISDQTSAQAAKGGPR
jgi:parallel beta-helix repeat protein